MLQYRKGEAGVVAISAKWILTRQQQSHIVHLVCASRICFGANSVPSFGNKAINFPVSCKEVEALLKTIAKHKIEVIDFVEFNSSPRIRNNA